MSYESVPSSVTADGLFEWNGSAWKPRGPVPANTRTPDGRFYFDGTGWIAIPSAPPAPLLAAHRRVVQRKWWFVIVPMVAVGGVVATMTLFYLVGLLVR